MSAHRDQSVTTCRLGDSAGDAGHVVLIVDVDPAGLDLAGRRLLAGVREAVAAWEVAEAARDAEAAPAREAPRRPPGTPQPVLRSLPQQRDPFRSEETTR